MFDSQTRFSVLFVACACVSVTLATQYVFTGAFVETRTDAPYAQTGGYLYYLYDTAADKNCRFRLDYYLPGGKVSNLYQYDYDAYAHSSVLYSMCDKCSAQTLGERPDKWWYDSKIYKNTSRSQKVGSTTYYWFDKITLTASSMVKSILMNGATDPTKVKVAGIEFYDGRTYTITNFKRDTSYSSSSSVFKTISGCPTPTCLMFTDIVFVLDYSGSVSKDEWNQTANFVIGVINSFTFGDQGAAAACINFSNTAQGLVYGTNGGKQTVTTSKSKLVNAMKTERKPKGGTCQGSGLELAQYYFGNSSRKKRNPHKIVIAVTDGEDGCKDRTKKAAKKLREDYDAFFIGIGVGINKESSIYFIGNLTSTIAGTNTHAYYNVSNYDEIGTVVSQIFAPMCDQYSADYEAGCKGFRACGKCFCPNCTTPSDKCQSVSCTTRDGTSNGCVKTTKNCNEAQNTVCVPRYCNASTGNCVVGDLCASKRNEYPYPCQTVTCNNGNGTCSIAYDDDTCKLKHRNDCEEWRCQHNANGISEDDYGCVMVRNVTAECNNKKKKCLTVKCNTDTLSCDITDNCPKQNNECHKFTCEGEGNSAVCTNHDVARPKNLKDDECTKYKCFNKTGWQKDEDTSLNAMKCRNIHINDGKDPTCLKFSCVPSSGCYHENDTDCISACKDLEDECWSNVSSTFEKCEFTRCTGSNENDTHCVYSSTNCTESEQAKLAESKNRESNNTACYTYYCSYGTCEFAEVLPRHQSTKCVTWTCSGNINEGWKWVMSYTDEHDNCHNDVCYERVCDDEEGCIPVKDICESKTTKCTSYTCENNVTCTPKNLLRTFECMHEECNPDGTVRQVWPPLLEMCPDRHDCTLPSCPNDIEDPNFGTCVYTNVEHGDDPCTNYTCNTTDNTWIESPKCDDHLSCTEDKCSVDGDCWTVEIDCYQEINMTDYPCFRAACKEDVTSAKGYRCVRKIKSGAYIDICGRCIRDGEIGSDEPLFDEEKESLACTDAPEEPILKEGIAAASIAMIILGAVIVGGVVTTSGVLGTKTLLERARAANNQTAHSNPLFEDSGAELSNPAFIGGDA